MTDLLLFVIRDRFEINDFGADILCDLFDLKFPEMGRLDPDVAPGDCHDTILGLLDPFADLLPFPDIDGCHEFTC